MTTERSLDRPAGGYGFSVIVALLVASIVARPALASFFDDGRLRTWSTVFVAICLQALPFLCLGVVLSGVIAACISETMLKRVIPQKPALAVPFAGICGIALPGCECGSVPIAGRLVSSGVPPAAALTFLLAAPAVNPVVLIATAVAFPNDHRVWIARFVASMVTSVVVGWLWMAFGRTELLDRALKRLPDGFGRLERFRRAAVHDLLHAGGYLIVGAAAAAAMQVLVPRRVIGQLASNGAASVLALALLAVVLSICSEADAFVASGLTEFSLTARLVFMVVGPGVDLKLIAMQSGVFSRRFALVFAPTTFVVAVVAAVGVGTVML